MSIDTLNERVTEAILRAESLAASGPSSERDEAYAVVSACEEALAGRLRADDEEGAIARRGAVRAALKAGRPARAKELAERYASEAEAPAELVEELRRMGAQSQEALFAMEIQQEFAALRLPSPPSAEFPRLVDETSRVHRRQEAA